jgi:hypothetical protein
VKILRQTAAEVRSRLLGGAPLTPPLAEPEPPGFPQATELEKMRERMFATPEADPFGDDDGLEERDAEGLL